MTQLEGSILLSMMITILFLVSTFTFLVSIATPANLIEELFLPHIPVIFADHGQEISLILNSGHFIPLTRDEGNQVRVSVNYTTNNSTIIDNTINAVMKVYEPNRTAIPDNQIKNITAVVQFTDATKTIPISNPVQIRLNLTQPTVSEAATRPEIAAFLP